LENRQNTGWDTYLFGHGMLITHIYYNKSTWDANTPNNTPTAMGVDIVEADGTAIESLASLGGDPFPGTSNVTSYSPLLRSGTNIGKPLTFISETNGVISFRFMGGGNIPTITEIGTPTAFSTVQGTPSDIQTITISGTHLVSEIKAGFGIGLHFEMKKESDTTWADSIKFSPTTDSIISNQKIQIRYNPKVPSYSTAHTETLKLTANNATTTTINLSGKSTRPVYVVQPIATNATDTTYTSFVAHWNSVFDATGYYLTVYSTTNEASSQTEGFDNGLTASNGWTITAKTISNSTLYSGATPPAIQFSNTGESVVTEKYVLPATSLSFYLRSLGGNYGGFLIEAQNQQNSWEKVDSISVIASLLEQNKSYLFNVSKGYIRFRFTYLKGIGSIVFDDVKTGFNGTINYKFKDNWITNNFDTLTSLSPNTQYFYKVKASDKSIYYENITDFSNIIQTITLTYPSATRLQTTIDKTGNITVYLPTVNYNLYVYDLVGKCIKAIVPDQTTFTITDLPRNHVYIFKSNGLVTKIFI